MIDMNKIWDKANKDYIINKNFIWLNSCGTNPAGTHIIKEIKNYIKEYGEKCILTKKYPLNETKECIQNILSKLLDCSPDDIAIVHNTAEGMNFISYGLQLKKNDEVLLLENEYPSNVYPWEHWQNKGVKIKTISAGNSPDEFLNNFNKSISKNTKLAAVSAVHWCTGMPLPIKEVSQICKKRNIDLALDAAQGAGHVPIKINEWDIPFTSFSAWKWLLGPIGLGILIIPKKHLKKLNPVFKGTSSVKEPEKYLPYQDKLMPTVERYMISTPNFCDWVYFKISLEYLDKIGFDNVMKRIYELSGCIEMILKESGFKVLSDNFYLNKSKVNTGIIVAEKEGIDPKVIIKKLQEYNIIVRERLGRIRIAPHIFISIKQLDKLKKTLKIIL